MPRLSLYKPEKGNDFRFIDKTVWEMFQVGGTDVLIHKYLGPGSSPAWNSTTSYKVGDTAAINNRVYRAVKAHTDQQPPNSTYWDFVRQGTPSQPIYSSDNVFNIQDLLFLENRDRKYSQDIYVLRGIYNVQDIDFNLSQFGLFLQNDTIFVTFHINDTVDKVGRKLISGDVIELPHLKDDYAGNDLQYALKRFYVVEEVNRASEGFSVTWYPHLYRAKCKPLVDSQEYKDILDGLASDDNYRGTWKDGVTYYPGDVVLSDDGVKYVCIDPIAEPWDTAIAYYPGDFITFNGEKYIVVDNSVPAWNGDTTYMPGDTFTGPDGKIYTVLDTPETQFGVVGVLPPDAAVYETVLGTGVVGVDPENSDRFKSVDVVNNGITNVFPPNTTYWEISQTLRDVMSTYEREMQITEAVLNQAELDSPKSGPDTTKLYSLQKGEDGLPEIVTVDSTALDASEGTQATDDEENLLFNEDGSPVFVGNTASTVLQTASKLGYHGIIYEGDGVPHNGAPFTAGISFPANPVKGQFCLRKDYLPHRLFRFNGTRWAKVEDKVRMTMNNLGESDVGLGDRFEGKDARQTLRTSFVNNTNTAKIDGRDVKERQSLSQALKPEADE
jgi:hypothetical protein